MKHFAVFMSDDFYDHALLNTHLDIARRRVEAEGDRMTLIYFDSAGPPATPLLHQYVNNHPEVEGAPLNTGYLSIIKMVTEVIIFFEGDTLPANMAEIAADARLRHRHLHLIGDGNMDNQYYASLLNRPKMP